MGSVNPTSKGTKMKYSNHLLLIIQDLRATRSANAKKAILKAVEDDQAWKDYLVAVYSPFTTYGVAGDKIDKQDNLYNLKLCRSINAGITATTINQVYKGLIPSAAQIMKAKPAGPAQVKLPVVVEWKYDGHYTVIVVPRQGDYRFYTSGGHEYTLNPKHNDTTLQVISRLPRGVYFAERVSDGLLGSRKDVALLGSKANGQLQYCKPENTFKLFDVVNLEEFEAGESEYGAQYRGDVLRTILANLNGMHMAARRTLAIDYNELRHFISDALNSKAEGVMLKQPDCRWRNSKSRRLDYAKYKLLQTADLLCVRENHGQTAQTQDVIGSLTLRDKTGTEVNVSSGLSDLDRAQWGGYKGEVIEVRYEHKREDGTYIQPVYLHTREDKTPDDID